MIFSMFIKNSYCSKSKGYGHFVILCAFLLFLSGCNLNQNSSSKSLKKSLTPPAANNDYFQEIGKEIGIDFIHSIGDNDLHNIVESSCGGTAFLDYDQDGLVDLYVTSGTWIKGFSMGNKPDILPANHLYRNLGNGTFEDVTKKSDSGGPW